MLNNEHTHVHFGLYFTEKYTASIENHVDLQMARAEIKDTQILRTAKQQER